MYIKKAVLAMALLVAGMASASANVIVNGDFSSGDLSGWTSFLTPTGHTSPSVVSYDMQGAGPSLVASFHVGNTVFDGTAQGGGIKQTLTTAAGACAISADIGAFGIKANASAGLFQLLIDSVVVDSIDLLEIGIGEKKTGVLSYAGFLGAGDHELSILMTRTFLDLGNVTQYLDNVVVAEAEAIPEPGNAALFGIGLLGLALLRRRVR